MHSGIASSMKGICRTVERGLEMENLPEPGHPKGARGPCFFMSLNDDLSLTLTVHQVAETRVSHDRPVEANMASREHY